MDPKLLKLLSLTLCSIDFHAPDVFLGHHPRILAELERMSQVIKRNFPGYFSLLIEHIEANDNDYQKAKTSLKHSQVHDKVRISAFLDQYEIFFCKYFFSSPLILSRYNLVPSPTSTSVYLNAEQLNVDSQ